MTSDGRGNLYGTTYLGGASDRGTVFTVRTDGTGIRRLHTFTRASEGFTPAAPLILDGFGNLFGTTTEGGAAGRGTLFSIRVDGGGFQVLHSFAGGASDGGDPFGALTLDGAGNLYGTTGAGGLSEFGTVFRLRTDGTGFQILHFFAGGPSDGRYPVGALVLDGSGNLYGTTSFGGQPPSSNPPDGRLLDGDGTVFRIKTDGTGYQLLRTFVNNTNDAAVPSGSLTWDGSGNLYGMTVFGGSSESGTVFRIGMDGSGLQILHSFAGDARDEGNPVGSLVLDRSGNLYGVTGERGASGSEGAVFRIRTDSTGYQVLHTFVDTSDGRGPLGSLVLDGPSETLYGAMKYGGSSNSGTIFSISTDGSLFQVSYAFAGFKNDGSSPMAAVIQDGSGYLYGTTPGGGPSNAGAVFRIRSDGTGFQLLHAFGGGSSEGTGPEAPLILDHAGNLYGTTNAGGPSNVGTVFKVRTDGTGFQLLHAFLGGGSDGTGPTAALILDGADDLYGTTPLGGPANLGTIFKIKTDGAGYQIIHTFTIESLASEGGSPYSSLLLKGPGDLIGMTAYGGLAGQGTVFRVRTDGSGFHLLRSFTGGLDDGGMPTSSLIMDGSGNLYGTTAGGGSSNVGTIFKMKTDGTGFQLLHSFPKTNVWGTSASATVILDGFANLYGTTLFGGPSDVGTVFTVKTDGTGFRVLHTFGDEASDGQAPFGSLFLNGRGTLIGTTTWGGAGSFGTMFSISIDRQRGVVTPKPFVPVDDPRKVTNTNTEQ